MTDQELHLQDAFESLCNAQAALDGGDMEELAACLAEAGFSICCALPEQYAERAPDDWFETQGGIDG
ncbi:hypothetical protein [Acidithiobacillus sp.]|uniref:hypothetical protein n=1 Tax=Acidithiobacillus sp. TaxID=1872118 RepID=UPI0025C18AF7|nr:hypothetical protein [Acidithiobacillus sp.]